MRKILLIIILLFAVNSYAETYWVDDDGAANWTTLPNCQGATPLSGSDACALSTANANALGGDIVYMRGGSYDTNISPDNSGTSASHMITYEAYDTEIPTFDGLSNCIYLSNVSYVKIKGITCTNPTDSWAIIRYNTHHYEVSYSTFSDDDGDTTNKGFKIWGDGPDPECGTAPATYECTVTQGWIHHNTMHTIGTTGAAPGCDDTNGGPVHIGTLTYDYDSGNYHTFENNVIYEGSHHLVETYGPNMVIRNNTMHGEGWITGNPLCDECYTGCSNDMYGSRVLTVKGTGAHRTYNRNLIEGNRLGHGGCPSDGGGGIGLVIGSAGNIIRYNYSFNNNEAGYYFKVLGWGSQGDDNHFYNNTAYKNARRPDCRLPSSLDQGITLAGTTSGNVVYNNLVYDSGVEEDIWCLGGSNTGLYNCTSGSPLHTFLNNYITTDGDPLFVDTDVSTPADSATKPDLSVQGSSGVIDAGTHLTAAYQLGSSSTSLTVDDAGFFQAGSQALTDPIGCDLSDVEGDYIAIGTVDNVVQITDINYSTNVITLASAMTWADDAYVWLYKKSDGEVILYGSAPDQGAYESLLATGYIEPGGSNYIEPGGSNYFTIE